MGGGITILNIIGLLGEERLSRFLFNVRPDLKGKVENVKLIKKECPNCEDSEVVKKGVLFGWEFEVDGQKQTLYADQHCTSCQSKVMSKEITEEMEQKRKDTLLSKWWYLNEKENFGF